MSLTFHPLPGVPPVEGEVGAWLHVAETLPPSPLRIPALLPASSISYEDRIFNQFFIFEYKSYKILLSSLQIFVSLCCSVYQFSS